MGSESIADAQPLFFAAVHVGMPALMPHIFLWLEVSFAHHGFQIDVSVNAPKAGKITELLAEEESTVTVGQDLFKLAPGESGECEYRCCHPQFH